MVWPSAPLHEEPRPRQVCEFRDLPEVVDNTPSSGTILRRAPPRCPHLRTNDGHIEKSSTIFAVIRFGIDPKQKIHVRSDADGVSVSVRNLKSTFPVTALTR